VHEREAIQTTRLPSGLHIITESMPGVASVALGISVDAGSADELTPNVYGQAHFLEHMLFKGTETRTAYTLAEAIEDVGGQLNAFTERETTHLYVRVLADHLPTALELLADMVCHSTFPAEEFDRERQVVIEEIRKYEAMPDERIHDLIMEALWQDGGLGHAILGTEDSVRGFTPDLIRQCWLRHFSVDRLIITVAGKLEHEPLVAQVAEAFAAAPVPASLPAAAPGNRVAHKVLDEDEEQIQFAWGVRSYPAADERNYALTILDAILGASATSRLFQEIREKRGLAYDVASYTMAFRTTGLLCASGATSPETFREVIELMHREILTLKRNGISERELARAKEQMKSGMAISLESSLERMRRLATHQLTWGAVYPLDYLLQRTNAVTRDEVMAVAEDLLQLDQWAFTAIGPVDLAEILPFITTT